MKKIFGILAVALIAFSFASCKGKNDPKKENFKIDVTEITATGATVAITPADTTAYYYWTIVGAEFVKQYTADTVAALLMEEEIEEWGSTFESLVEDYYIVKGSDKYTFSTLDPETSYSVIAFQVDHDLNVIGHAATKDFTTLEFKIIGHEALTISDAELYDYTDWGLFQIMAEDAANQIGLAVTFYAESLEGSFTKEDLFEEYSGMQVGADILSIIDVTATTALVENGAKLKMTGKLVASNGIEYDMTITAVPAEEEAPARKMAAKHFINKKVARR